MSDKFGYYVNLDERGDFYADVRNEAGDTVFEIRSDEEGVVDLVEDGFMSDKTDISGLRDHLVTFGVVPAGSELMSMSDFESALEEEEPEEDDDGPDGP